MGQKSMFAMYAWSQISSHTNQFVNRKGIGLTGRTGGRGFLGNVSVGVLAFLLSVYL